ncbi:Maf family protein [Metallibacterium scheffleri]|jgi:septum formation protein|uniref:Maf family protein n=1 Tax=Metallibacterium scheffleri TaxID=993689 RepID=UPI0026EDD29A|nr:Maf family protein [Metallibacterium scheffleri]MBW8074853.1 septum formation inhibitor Maf [Metallibacterium scheffleri]
MTVGSRLYLASRSPRRRELLARLGCLFEVLDPDVPERRAPGESPADYVRRVAAAKAEAGWNSLGASAAGAWVLGADTEVVLDDVVFGKPADAEQALAMLRRLSGREHTVLSALCLRGATGAHGVLVESSVRFASLDDATLRDYVAGGEPFGKAGAYAIQGHAECFVTRLCGSYSGVMGLPLAQTAALLRAAGLLPKSSS